MLSLYWRFIKSFIVPVNDSVHTPNMLYVAWLLYFLRKLLRSIYMHSLSFCLLQNECLTVYASLFVNNAFPKIILCGDGHYAFFKHQVSYSLHSNCSVHISIEWTEGLKINLMMNLSYHFQNQILLFFTLLWPWVATLS